MSPLTLQEVVDRINKAHASAIDLRTSNHRTRNHIHWPEFSIRRITRFLPMLTFSRRRTREPQIIQQLTAPSRAASKL